MRIHFQNYCEKPELEGASGAAFRKSGSVLGCVVTYEGMAHKAVRTERLATHLLSRRCFCPKVATQNCWRAPWRQEAGGRVSNTHGHTDACPPRFF